ncbi:DUF1657 domain-containing protein [Ornithinibacillus contaminans]|uniref:DUF1657 domain-containing protein n=1 Tax=Ornithinibacillus contaminans TaxID=694055 RepID=UPI00064DF383|nr:DUF1657 domain-containing protein [Ornithinibacillus contaminans]
MTVSSQVKTCYASIKNIEATLAILRAQTNEASARNVYFETEQLITTIRQDLEQQVLMLAREEPQYKQ